MRSPLRSKDSPMPSIRSLIRIFGRWPAWSIGARLTQFIEEQLDIGALRWALTFRYFDTRAKDAAVTGIVAAFLRPIDLASVVIDCYSDTPFRSITARTRVALTRIHEGFDIRAIEVRAHDAHAFAIRPVDFASLLVELLLLRREGSA